MRSVFAWTVANASRKVRLFAENVERRRGLRTMKKVEYVACPSCGMNKVIHSATRVEAGKPETLRWADFDVRTMEFIQIREGGGKTGTGKKGRGQGKGVGFYKVGAMSLEEAVNAGGVYLDIARAMANQILKVSRELRRLGLIP